MAGYWIINFPPINFNPTSNELKTNENTCLVNKDWADNDTLEDILEYEHQKVDKSEYIQEDIELLKKNRLKRLGDWKNLSSYHLFRKKQQV